MDDIQELLRQHNAQRRANKALVIDERLQEAAQAHAEWMDRRNSLRHTGRFGQGPNGRARAAGYPSSTIAENIAQGQRTVDEVMASWLRSRGHARNIRGPYVHVGFGRSGNYWCVKFGGGSRPSYRAAADDENDDAYDDGSYYGPGEQRSY